MLGKLNYHKSGDLVASSEYKEVKAVELIVTCDVNMRSCHVKQGSFHSGSLPTYITVETITKLPDTFVTHIFSGSSKSSSTRWL